ncbi:GyrI-like domain-containing protein [Paenibacillus dendritiformis]|uniref:GyrI-like domain-containing protein n=1 Tax=Paenibacillus dendritiformis TaxID=130049 RepID=UPI000DA7682C|nr:GyrI-like domain-containing protein [Paenibacillus dendritiformis]PZM66381.1 AraC family transcriptional regulator [Paenibacillus dendritiformis]
MSFKDNKVYGERSGFAHQGRVGGTGQPSIATVPGFTIAGVAFEANLETIADKKLGKLAYETMLARRAELAGSVSDNIHLVQIYPMKPDFNPQVDPFTQIIGYLVPEVTTTPDGMVMRAFPESAYVTMTHRGRECELGQTYDLLYGQWMREHGREPAGYDFEVWDERYRPDSEDNEIEVFVALRSDQDKAARIGGGADPNKA